MNLLLDEYLNSISVSDIVKKADISRVTFYYHFKNKEDVVDSVIESILSDFDSILKEKIPLLEILYMQPPSIIKKQLFKNTEQSIKYFYTKRHFISVLISDHVAVDFTDLLLSVYYNNIFSAMLTYTNNSHFKTTLKNYTTYMTSGIMSVIELWFLSDFKTPVEILTLEILDLFSASINSFFKKLH